MLSRQTLVAVIVPGCVFQAVMIGGGYCTGREVVQYFTRYGAWGGIGAIAVAAVLLAVFLAFVFEAARFFAAYDYNTLLRPILGPLFPVLEALNVLMLVLVLSILGAAAGHIFEDRAGVPAWLGLMGLTLPIAILNYCGREVITRILSCSTVLLYMIFIAFLIFALRHNDKSFTELAANASSRDGWAVSGCQFALYNCAAAMFILYAARSIRTRSHAIIAGAVGGFTAMLPAVLLHVSLLTRYQEVVGQDLPTYWMLERFGSGVFTLLFTAMLLFKLVETGAGILQGVNDRLDILVAAWRGYGLSRGARAATAGGAVLLSTALSTFGVKDLIGRGYGTIAWVYLAVLILPLFVRGTLKMRAGAASE